MMRSLSPLFSVLLPLLAVSAYPPADLYRVALPGYHYEFPRDNFDHPDYKTEWWYYTGNLKSTSGRRFGFELTFFRQGVTRTQYLPSDISGSDPGTAALARTVNSEGSRTTAFVWPVRDIYLAHLALSDIDGRHYFHAERLNRAGPGLAGADLQQSRIWNGNWQVVWQGNVQQLQAIAGQFALHVSLRSLKPAVINGQNGISQKASGHGKASYYISLTRIEVSGSLRLNGQSYPVTGTAWMDHEFFTAQLDPAQTGWDWLGLQLDDGSELLLYRLRRRDGSVDPYSAGTYVDSEARSHHLTAAEFSLDPGQPTWTSPASRATYPVRWQVRVPSLGVNLEISTPLEQQEFTSRSSFAPSYWEGAIRAEGTKASRKASGLGYLEMTGYASAVDLSH